MKRHLPYAVLVAAILLLDQLSKAIIVKTIPFYGSIRVISGFFDLTHIHNKGAIFGVFNQSEHPMIPIVLLALNCAALALVVYYFLKTSDAERGMKVALTLIIGGAFGNVLDRIFRGYVIDFIEMYSGRFHFPTYNLADSSITIGAVLLLVTVIFRRPHASDPV